MQDEPATEQREREREGGQAGGSAGVELEELLARRLQLLESSLQLVVRISALVTKSLELVKLAKLVKKSEELVKRRLERGGVGGVRVAW